MSVNFSFKIVIISAILSIQLLCGQQVIDTSYVFNVTNPAFKYNKGPLILIDEAHNNGAKLSTAFLPLSKILLQDGYRTNPLTSLLNEEKLENADILVIIDALSDENVNNWELPTPSAFSLLEIEIIIKWVSKGGSLLLVADHMPFSGASSQLAEKFDITIFNGFAIDTVDWDVTYFKKSDLSLKEHAITQGRNPKENIDIVVSYFGHAFKSQNDRIIPLLVFQNNNIVTYQPKKAWRFNPDTPKIIAKGLLQAAAIEFGNGRVVLLGDSAMISAHLIGEKRNPVGMNASNSKDNAQFALNIFHWLSLILP